MEMDIFTPATKAAPTKETIVDFLNVSVRAYFSFPGLLDPYKGQEIPTKMKKKKKGVVLTPPQRAIFDYGGRWAIEKDGAGERMFYYWAHKKGEPEVRMAFFMAEQSFKIVTYHEGGN
jgi:hypothetical protein